MRLAFITDRFDAHSARFSKLFETLAKDYLEVRVSNPDLIFQTSHPELELNTWKELQSELERIPTVVISGPLDTVTAEIAGGEYQHVGISWATDIMVTAAESGLSLQKFRDTVGQLDYVLTDNYASENALISVGMSDSAILRLPWGPGDGFLTHQLGRKQFGLTEGKKLILFGRGLQPHYEPHTTLEAFAGICLDFPETELVFFTTGSELARCRNLSKDLGISNRVRWIPPVAEQDMNALLGAVDLLVSSAQTDGTSVTLLQAMAAGTPVLCSVTNGSAEWVMNGITGFTYSPGNVSQLQNQLRTILASDEDQLQLISKNARVLVNERAGWEKSSRILAERIQSLLGNT